MVLHYNASIYHGSFPPGDGGISRHDQGPSGGVSLGNWLDIGRFIGGIWQLLFKSCLKICSLEKNAV